MKLHKDRLEQIEILRSRGLDIDDVAKADDLLSNLNYYRLSGYLFGFRKPKSEDFIQGITLNRILRLYKFDCKLTRILMYAMENVEESLKTHFSYELSSNYPEDPLIYLDKKIYRSEDEVDAFTKLFEKSKKDNKGLPFIKHHNARYSGNLPIWVAVEIMTLGNIHKLYNNLIGKHQKSIAKRYNTGSKQLKNWIENLAYTRNHLAHYMRIYDYSFGRNPADCDRHIPFQRTGRIFDQIELIGFIFSDEEEWHDYIIPEIGKIYEEYKDTIELKKIGFPENWMEVLHSISRPWRDRRDSAPVCRQKF